MVCPKLNMFAILLLGVSIWSALITQVVRGGAPASATHSRRRILVSNRKFRLALLSMLWFMTLPITTKVMVVMLSVALPIPIWVATFLFIFWLVVSNVVYAGVLTDPLVTITIGFV